MWIIFLILAIVADVAALGAAWLGLPFDIVIIFAVVAAANGLLALLERTTPKHTEEDQGDQP